MNCPESMKILQSILTIESINYVIWNPLGPINHVNFGSQTLGPSNFLHYGQQYFQIFRADDHCRQILGSFGSQESSAFAGMLKSTNLGKSLSASTYVYRATPRRFPLTDKKKMIACPNCGSKESIDEDVKIEFICNRCGYEMK